MAMQASDQGPGRFGEAFAYALELHRDQVRKQAEGEDAADGIPYIAHLMAVSALVLEHGGDEDEAIAALLHDGPEDQGGEKILDEIRKRFGDRVADTVAGCSDTLVADREDKPEWRPRKDGYLAHLWATASPSVFLVSMADKVHNLRSIVQDHGRIGERLWDRFTGEKDGTLWYYGALLEVYREKAPARFAGLVEEMERLYRQLLSQIESSS